MREVWLVVMLAGCGRVGFDAPRSVEGTGDAGDDGGSPIDSVPASAVFARYPLDDDFSATMMARDTSGNGRNMTCAALSCPVQGQARPGGPLFASLFDGVDDLLSWQPLGGEADLATFTITAWIRLVRRPVDLEAIVARSVGGGPTASFGLDHLSTGQMRYGSGLGSSLFGTSIVPLTTWTHVAISFDGTVKRMYVAGVSEGSASQGGVTYDPNPLMIGARITIPMTGNFFQGQISDVVIFDRVMSDAEIATLAQ